MALGAEVADYQNPNVPKSERPQLEVLEGGQQTETATEPQIINETLLPLVEVEPVIDYRTIFDNSMRGLIDEFSINQYFDQDYSPRLKERNIYIWELSQVEAGLKERQKISYGLGLHVKKEVGMVDDAHIFMFLGAEDEIQKLLISYKKAGENGFYISNFDSQPDFPPELAVVGLHLQESIHEVRHMLLSDPNHRHIGQSFIQSSEKPERRDSRYF